MLENIGIAAAVIGGVSLLIGLLLGLAGRLLAVKTDPREEAVREHLPGSNCGGCGYAGCDALAAAIVSGEAPANACPSCAGESAKAIADIMGSEVGETVRRVAYIHCAGTCDKAKTDANYYGAVDCRQAAIAPGGNGKACRFACFGLGTCAHVCPVDAIRVENGVAIVDPETCIACGKCVTACPQNIIDLRPANAAVEVRCSNRDAGKDVKAVCSVGCIACGICQKNCPTDAITVIDRLAVVDHEKCIACGVCAEKCPVKIIELL